MADNGMLWSAVLLASTGIYAAGISYYLHKKTSRLKFLGLLLAAIAFIVIELAAICQIYFSEGTVFYILERIIEWGYVYCLALVLGALFWFVRESKPEFLRLSRFYGLLPLFIVLSYLLVYDAVLLKTWLINIYQGGAAIVAVMMYGIYSYRDSIYLTVEVGAIFFLLAFIIYLIAPEEIIIWHVTLAISIIFTFSGYLIVQKQYATQN